MARVSRNVLLKGLEGVLGDDLIVKRDKAGRTLICMKPRFKEDRVFSEAQKTQQGRFRRAMAYAKDAVKREAVYEDLARGTAKTAYNVAISDWFNGPEVVEVDLSGYGVGVGQVIRARVVDDVRVVRVAVEVWDEAGVLVETGEMVEEGGDWFGFVGVVECPVGGKMVVKGVDLPGHEGVLMVNF